MSHIFEKADFEQVLGSAEQSNRLDKPYWYLLCVLSLKKAEELKSMHYRIA